MESLWPDFDDMPKAITPGTILKEQAAALGEKFQNKIQGRITVSRTAESFKHTFLLYCAPLAYRYKLFETEYKLLDLYPVSVTVEGDIAEELCGTQEESEIAAPTEEELKAVLKRIFAAQKTVHLIQALSRHME